MKRVILPLMMVAIVLFATTAAVAKTPSPDTTVLTKASKENAQKEDPQLVETCDSKTLKLEANEKRILDLHNEVRKKSGLEPLCVSSTLVGAARAHSEEMVDKDYFSHTSYDGERPGERLKRFSYDWRAFGENIASGAGSESKPDDRFKAWMKSPGHKKNILDGNFREIGVGSASGNFEGYEQTVYTVDFGTPR
jgi:uncharacterized protein YkwD